MTQGEALGLRRSAPAELIHGIEDSGGGERGMGFYLRKSFKIGPLRLNVS
jgi:hypothetical protein